LILLSLLGAGLDYFLMAWAPTVGWFFLGRAVSGLAGANITAATAYIADISPPEKRSANFGIIGAAFGLGFIAGPLLGGLLGEKSLRLPFIAAGVVTLANWLYGFFVLPESLGQDVRRKFSWARANPLGSFLGLTRNPVVLGLAVALFLMNLGQFGVQNPQVGDLNHDGVVTGADIGLMLGAWTAG
jgi:DHA1 family tetracycline resistance protein-like MFS transporter